MSTFTTNAKPPNRIVEAIKNDANFRLFYYSSKFFLYEDNYYKEINIENRLYEYIASPETISTNLIKEVKGLLQMNPAFLLDESKYEIEPERYINFQNGILDLEQREIIPHTPDIIFFSKIPYDYEPRTPAHEMTEKLIQNFIQSDNPEEEQRKRRMLFEYLGVIISNIRGQKNFLYLLGEKDTGKSTFCGLIMRLLGKGNYSALPINDLKEDGFYLHQTIGKKANILTETDDAPLKSITTLKKLTGGKDEEISCHVKYAPNLQQITPRIMLIFAGNSIPPLWNSGDKKAFLDRMIVVKFESPVADKDKVPNILDKISMKYIVREAVDRLYGFIDNNMVFTQPAQSKAIRNDLLGAEDVVYAFVQDCDLSDKRYKIHTATLYRIFQTWASQNAYNVDKITSNLFTRRLKEIIGADKNKKVSINGSPSLIGFTGIKPPSAESLGVWGAVYDGQVNLPQS
jgi:putative DNA primase/helicase